MKNLSDYLFFREGLVGVWKEKIVPLGRIGAILILGLIVAIIYFPLMGLKIIGRFVWKKRWLIWENTMIPIKYLLGFILLIGILFFSISTALGSGLVLPFAFLIYGSRGINELKEFLYDDTYPFLWNIKSQWPSIKQCPLPGVSIVFGAILFCFSFSEILPNWIRIFALFLGMTLAYAGSIKSNENDSEPIEAS